MASSPCCGVIGRRIAIRPCRLFAAHHLSFPHFAFPEPRYLSYLMDSVSVTLRWRRRSSAGGGVPQEEEEEYE